MMTDLVVWSGPVAPFQVKGATIPGAKELFLQCRGDQGDWPWCPGIGDSMMGSTSSLLQKAGVPASELRELVFGGFSAGGSFIKRLMGNPDYRAITTAVMLSDATYTSSWVDSKNQIPPAIPGFVDWAMTVLGGPGDKLFVATASPVPNKSWASGVQNLQAIRHEIEKKTGQTFELMSHFYGIEPAPEAAYKLGNVILAEYPESPLGHGHNSVAPAVWQQILLPWLSKGKGPVESPHGLQPPGGDLPFPVPGTGSKELHFWEKLALFGAGALASYAGARLLMRRKQ